VLRFLLKSQCLYLALKIDGGCFLYVEFSEAQSVRICRRRGGFCSFRRCPGNSFPIGSCGGRRSCCRW
uniref:Beta-defensin-like domain-containing protein n=1 Tax=Pelusios castaneus TaxID=367368 RepID=A0A8C8VLM0_9SAUR